MSRRLLTSDLTAILDLAHREPSLNLWTVADVENFGLETDFLELWGSFAGASLRAVVLRFHSHFVAYSADTVLPEDLVAVLRSPRLRSLSGRAATLEPITGGLGFARVTRQWLAELTSPRFRPCPGPTMDVRHASAADAEGLHELASSVAEFSGGTLSAVHDRLGNPRVRTYCVREDSRIVSAASTTIECSTSAMIGGVMTHPAYRRRGFASACLSRLCADLLGSGKVCCLTYHNPRAGSIYDRLGFTVVSPWLLATR